MIDIRQIEAFLKVYETKSYTRAAEELYTSRQALRYTLKTFEDILAEKLFVQSGRTLVPTELAEQIYMSSFELQAALSRFEQTVGDTSSPRRKLRVGMVNGIHDVYRKERFKEVHGLQTAKHCRYVTTDCDTLRSMLRTGEIDIAYLVSGESRSDEFDSRYSHTGRIHLMVHKSSPLATHEYVTIADLKGLPFVTQGPGYDLHGLIEEECRRAGFELDVVFTCPSFFDITWQVNDDFGASYGLVSNITHYDAPDIVCIPFKEEHMRWYQLHLVNRNRKIAILDDGYWDLSSGFPEIIS